MKEQNALETYNSMPVSQAVVRNALPAMAAMLMTLIYNLADTFFIGQTHNAYQLAAVSLASPVFLIFMSVGMIFGIGGTSAISRAMGEGRKDHAKKISSFCMWSCVVVGIIMSCLSLLFMDNILALVGASADTWDFAKDYLTIVSFGGVFVLISNCFSNILRAEGQATKAMLGQIIGNLLNVILDPVMILGFGWDIKGAAIATLIGNFAAALYYVLYFIKGKSMLSIHIKDFCVGAKNWKRYNKLLKFSLFFAFAVSFVMTALCYLFTNQIVSAFITDVNAFDYAVSFSRILLTTSIFFGIFYVLTNAIQAMGAVIPALIINLSRQGIIYIPALYILNIFASASVLMFAQPIADILSICLAAILYISTYKKLSRQNTALQKG